MGKHALGRAREIVGPHLCFRLELFPKMARESPVPTTNRSWAEHGSWARELGTEG